MRTDGRRTGPRAQGELLALVAFGLASSAVLAVGPPRTDAATRTRVVESYGRLPLRFEANAGQADPRVKFLCRGSGSVIYLTSDEAVLRVCGPGASRSGDGTTSPGAVVRMKLVGANARPAVVGVDKLPGKTNYVIACDPDRSRADISTYARVEYRAVYPGVDLIYYGNRQELEFDFVVAPGADPSAIRLGFDGVHKLDIDAGGHLVLKAAGAEIRLRKPAVYQEVRGTRRPVAGQYVLCGANGVGFQVGAYDAGRPLVIDPVLTRSVRFGRNSVEEVHSVALDAAGNIYLAGTVRKGQNDEPLSTSNAYQLNYGGGLSDAFVAKLNPAGDAILWATYLGGSGVDEAWGVAVDGSGNAYVAGDTASEDFPTTPGALDRTYNGGPGQAEGTLRAQGDAFIAKFDAGGALSYSSYLGGSKADVGESVAVDSAGQAYVLGGTNSCDLLGPGVLGCFAGADVFLVKMNPQGSGYAFAGVLGGSGTEVARGMALDAAGNAWVTGSTNGDTLLTADEVAHDDEDAFVMKVDPTKEWPNSLPLFVRLRGSSSDVGYDIAVDVGGNVYVTGETRSSDFPLQKPLQQSLAGASDVFITKLDPSNGNIIWSTYLGGTGEDRPSAIAVNSDRAAHVVGTTKSSNFPVLNAVQGTFGGGEKDAFVTKLLNIGSGVDYSTYLGGGGSHPFGDDRGGDIVVLQEDAYIAGDTLAPEFPQVGAPLPNTSKNTMDGFIAMIRDEPPTFTFPEQDCGGCGAIGPVAYLGVLGGYLCLLFVRRGMR